MKVYTKIKNEGIVYTPTDLSNFVAIQILSKLPHTIEHLDILDPAVGDGELLLALGNALKESKITNFNLYGYDIDENAVTRSKNRLMDRFETDIERRDFVELINNDLFSNSNIKNKFDVIISNPPYVRTQVMGAKNSKLLSKEFSLEGRIDLYYIFLEGIHKFLKPGGIAGIIVSNRFMLTKSGAVIRRRLLEKFDILHIWDFGDTKLFKAAVLPSVLLLRKKTDNSFDKESGFTSIYSAKAEDKFQVFQNIFDALNTNGLVKVKDKTYNIQNGIINFESNLNKTWGLSTPESDDWLKIIKKNTWKHFSEISRIKVGVKSTADKVFIKKDWNKSYPRMELLRSLIDNTSARRYKSLEPKLKILYPYKTVNEKRVLVDIEDYPIAHKYLLESKDILSKRSYLIETGRKWYEIWVPHNPKDWEKPKLVFKDITEFPCFWMDLDKNIVNGDCYWLTCEDEDLLWLALAIANSKFIEKYYDLKFNNRLYSGRRRYMTQYVNEFPLLNPVLKETKKIIKTVKLVYKNTPSSRAAKLEKELDDLILAGFGLGAKEVPR